MRFLVLAWLLFVGLQQAYGDLLETYTDIALMRENYLNVLPDLKGQEKEKRLKRRSIFSEKVSGKVISISSLLGPSKQQFEKLIKGLPKKDRILFVDSFLKNWKKAGLGQDISSTEKVKRCFQLLKNLTVTPLSFLKEPARAAILSGNFPGLNKVRFQRYLSEMKYWVPFEGQASDAISSVRKVGKSKLQIAFRSMKSFQDFYNMYFWIAERLFPQMKWSKRNLDLKGVAEFYKNAHLYLLLKGGEAKDLWCEEYLQPIPEIELSIYKDVLTLEAFAFGKNIYRAENDEEARTIDFLSNILSARLYRNEWKNLDLQNSYNVISNRFMQNETRKRPLTSNEVKDLELSETDYLRFLERLKKNGNSRGKFLLPLLSWHKLPYLHARKKAFTKGLTKDYVNFIAQKKWMNRKIMSEALEDWITATQIREDVTEYLRVQASVKSGQQPLDFPIKTGDYDVNKVDVGIEYSARFPFKPVYQTHSARFSMKKHWVKTRIGIPYKEKGEILKSTMSSLRSYLGLKNNLAIQGIKEEDAHGHGISLEFKMKDKNKKTWRIEWDGIVRDYNVDGSLVENSARSGHVELVTPKFTPSYEEMMAVEKAFRDNNLIPSYKAGGGHINVDLVPFNGKPEIFGRFMSIFHHYRGILAFMFQYEGRLKSAEPAKVTEELFNLLIDYQGSETDLKNAFYNERYFNTRIGRKTRYLQLDISSYFQDVIPGRFIHKDFDILNPTVPWRQQFRVNPKIRKMEFRLMDAPKNAYASALQLKAVRALLNKAFNDNSIFTGAVSKVDYELYLKSPELAFKDLHKMTQDLGLKFSEYKGFVLEGIYKTRRYHESNFYRPYMEKIEEYIPSKGWGKAVDLRIESKACSYDERDWELPSGEFRVQVLPEATRFKKERAKELKDALAARKKFKKTNYFLFTRTIGI